MPQPSHPIYRIGLDARLFRKETAGIGRYTRELIEHLAALDTFNQYVVFCTPLDVPEWKLNQENFKLVVVPAPHFTWAEQTTFLQALRKEKLDLVHFLNFSHPILYRGNFVVTIHDLILLFFPAGRSKKSAVRKLAFVQTLRHATRAAKRVIAISESTAEDAEKHLAVPHAKMEVIYEGGPQPVELPFGNKAMAQDYIGSRHPYFLFVSSWYPHKGISALIEAFTIFKQKTGLPHVLVLLGSQKGASAEVKDAIAKSPFTESIIAPGFAPEELMPILYRNATAFIIPSEYEGFGLPPLEALTYGAPVISARNSSLPEVIGEAGLYFPTKDSAALAERMMEVVHNPGLALSLGEKATSQLRKFSWDKMARQTLALYMNVLEKKR